MQDSEEKHSALVSKSADVQKAGTHVIDSVLMRELLKTENPEAALHGFQLFSKGIENMDIDEQSSYWLNVQSNLTWLTACQPTRVGD